MVLSVIFARLSSCVTITNVCPVLSRRSKNSWCSSALFFESRLPEGSSASTTAGLLTRARATATRCFSPPDSSDGLCPARSESPMKSKSSIARCLASPFEAPAMNAGIMTFSNAVNSGSNWWNWNTKPTRLLRNSDSFFELSLPTSVPSMMISPLSGLSSVPMICSNVVLPAPLGPTMLTTSPFSMCRSMPLRTCSCPKLFVMPLMSIISCGYWVLRLCGFTVFKAINFQCRNTKTV